MFIIYKLENLCYFFGRIVFFKGFFCSDMFFLESFKWVFFLEVVFGFVYYGIFEVKERNEN